MQKYCKAYHLKDLRQFQNWTENSSENEKNLSGDDVVYLWDDFTVVGSPVIHDKDPLFSKIIPEWQTFCQETLKFEIPKDLRYAYEQIQGENDASKDALEFSHE